MPYYVVEVLNYKTTVSLSEGSLEELIFKPTVWDLPYGYTTPIQDVYIRVIDKAGLPVFGVKVVATDGNLNFIGRTNYDGLVFFPLPKNPNIDTQRWKLYIDGGSRYYSYVETIQISESNFGQDEYTEEVVLSSKLRNIPGV